MAEKNTKRGGLGLGLGALLGEEAQKPEQEPQTLPINRVEPRAGQPRTAFDDEALAELADSIRQYGLIQPITVRRLDGGYYQIIAGERRWRASRLAGLTEVPVRVIEADDRTTAELALVENLQREDLNPIEEARGYKTLMDDYGLTQEEASAAVGKSRPAIANALRLLSLCEGVMVLVENGELSAGHARTLVPVKDADRQLDLANLIISKHLSVRQAETLVSRLLAEKQQKNEEKTRDIVVDYVREVERELENALGRKVKLVDSRKKGRIELEFYGADDREALINNLLLFAKMRNQK